jgi:MFS family permease
MHSDAYVGELAKTKRVNGVVNFNKLWAASGISNLADGIGIAAAPLLAASLTRDPLLVAGLTVAQRLPWFVFSLVSGAIVDRSDRRAIMRSANLWRAFLLLGLGVALITDRISIGLLYLLFFGVGIIETLFDNAALAILPAIVDKNRLEEANGRLFATATLANELVGPPIGSTMFALFPAIPFSMAAVSFGLSSALIHRIEGHFSSTNDHQKNLVGDILEGVRWFWQHRLLKVLGFFAATFNFVFGATMSVLVLYAQENLGMGEAEYGLLLSMGALGGFLGGLATKPLSDRIGAGWVLFLDALLNGIAFIGIGLTESPWVAGLMFILISMTTMFGNVIIVSLRQAIIPDALLGRVASAYRLLVMGALPFGAFAGGLLARRIDLAAPFIAGGLLLGIAGFAIRPVVNNQTIEEALLIAESSRELESSSC